MTPYTPRDDLNGWDLEQHVLQWFEDNMPKSNKKLIKMSRYMRPLIPEYMGKSLCDVIENPRSYDPIAWLKQVIKELRLIPGIIDGLIADGNHGMIMDKGEIYGFSLITQESWLKGAGGDWLEDQEKEIGNQAVKDWMVANHRRKFLGRYVLFEQFGFSGVSYYGGWEIPEDEWEEKVKPIRDAERKHQKLVAEITKYQ